MAAPLLYDSNTAVQTGNTTSHAIPLPATVLAGQLLVVAISFDGNPTVTWDNSSHGTWSNYVDLASSSAVKLVVKAKVATGTEGGGTITITTSASEQSVARSMAFSTWQGTLASGLNITSAVGTTATPNSPASTDSWGSVDRKTISIFGVDAAKTVSTYPTNYTLNQFDDQSGGGAGVGMGSAGYNQEPGTAQDPGTYSISASDQWTAATISIRGGTAGLPNTAPTVALNTPNDVATGVSTTPALLFTGTDAQSDEIEYNVQVSKTGFTGNGYLQYYFDASDDAVSDPDNAWVNEANIFGTNYSAEGYSTASGSTSSNYVFAGGTNAPSSGDTILEVRVALNNSFLGGTSTNAVVYTDGLAQNLGTVTNTLYSGTTFAELSTPTGGWTWAKLQALEVKLYSVGTGCYVTPISLRVYTANIDKLSVTPDAGFSGTGDPHPWPSGNQVTYTVQAGDALANSTTYYWRVRGLDPSGTNSYGAWSSTRSFTTVAGGGGGSTGQVKVYNGTSFVAKPMKVWNGSAWVTKPVKRWNGSAWVATNY